MTTTITRKPRLTAAQKRNIENENLRLAKEQMDRHAAYKAESAKLVADSEDVIAEQTEVFVATAVTMINYILDTYKPRATNHNLEFVCSGYDFGVRLDDEGVNRVHVCATVDGKFKVSHSSRGEITTTQAMDFAAHLMEVAVIGQTIRDIGAGVFAQYEKSWPRECDAAAIDYRILSAIAARANPRIQTHLKLRRGR